LKAWLRVRVKVEIHPMCTGTYSVFQTVTYNTHNCLKTSEISMPNVGSPFAPAKKYL
jgi:hypothetical protein